MEFTILQIMIGLLAAVFVGFSKTGVPNMMIVVVAVMAMIFPAKLSVGILLPMLITADIVAVTYYRRTVLWRHLIGLIPWVLAGIVAGFFTLDHIVNNELSVLLGVLILSLITLHLSSARLENKLKFEFTQSPVFHGILGVLAGFTTMVGNAAGAIMTIYLLSKGLKKMEFIGTVAWFFLAVNLIKVPFNVVLELITLETLLFNLWMVPAVLAGAFLGIKILPLIPQKMFQVLILALAVLGGIHLIWEGVS